MITPIFNFFRQLTKGSADYKMIGNLTMKSAKRQVESNVEYCGPQNNVHGTIKHSFEVTGVINRKDFGKTWNKLTDTDGLGDDIKLIANIQIAELIEKEKESIARSVTRGCYLLFYLN